MKSLAVGLLWASRTVTVILKHSSLYLWAFLSSVWYVPNNARLPSKRAGVLGWEPKGCPHGRCCTGKAWPGSTQDCGDAQPAGIVGRQHRAMKSGLESPFPKLTAGRYLPNKPCPGFVLVGTVASYQRRAWEWTNARVSRVISGPGPKKELES